MRQLTLFFAALLLTSAACTQVKVTNSVSVIDAQSSEDAATDGLTSDAGVDPADGLEPPGGDGAVIVEDTGDGDSLDDSQTCIPECNEAECGEDGCGGVCGTCEQGEVCAAGVCCAPQCQDKACGDDGCGSVCGTCADTDACVNGVCVSGQTCEPDCVDTYCGDDGCSGSCGECVLLNSLDGVEAERDAVLRSLYGMGLDLGEQSFIDELSAQLAQAGLPGAVSLALPVTSGTSLDHSAGVLSCPLIALQQQQEPESQDCDQWAKESSGGVYADVVATLANPANMPQEVTSTAYGEDAEEAFLSGVKTGNERAQARARWDLAAAADPVCDITDGPISASKRKGVIVGAHHFKNVLNTVSDSASFSFSGEYPVIPQNLTLCSFSESLLQVAYELAKVHEPDDLPVSEPCGGGFNPPPQLAETYTATRAAFDQGVLIGIDAEYYVASVAYFEDAECGLGP